MAIRGTVTIQLVNQLEDKQHHTDSYTYRDVLPDAYSDKIPDASAAQVSDTGHSNGWGLSEFLPHSKLGLSVANNRQYLKDDCLIFRIVSVKLK